MNRWFALIPVIWCGAVYDLHWRGRPEPRYIIRMPQHKEEQRRIDWAHYHFPMLDEGEKKNGILEYL